MLSRSLLGFVAVIAFCATCAHLPQSAVPGPNPSPSASASPSPMPSGSGACNIAAVNTTAFIVISVEVLPTTAPIYGPINGYVEANTDGTFSLSAQIVTLHSNDIVQFVNVDADIQSAAIYHSAVGFPQATSFPTMPYTFPAATAQALGTSISSAEWSTGRFGVPGVLCYSQAFSLSPGTYYFGDYDFYNSLTSLRGVIVVQASSTQAKRRASPIVLDQ